MSADRTPACGSTARRGAAIVETCLVMVPMLMLLLGALQLGIIGYFQIVSNGASYEGGREAAFRLGNVAQTAALNSTYTKRTTGAGVYTATPVTQPATGINFQYADSNYYNTDATGQPIVGYTPRIGGIQFIRNGLALSNTHFSGISGFNLFNLGSTGAPTIDAVNIEAQPAAVGNGYNPSNLSYDDASWFSNSGTANWIQQPNVNVPPLFGVVQFDYGCAGEYEFVQGPDCIPPYTQYVAYGLGEYLDDTNYGKPPGVFKNQAFEAMACHQRYYASLLASPFSIGSFPPYGPSGYTPATAAEGYLGSPSNMDTRFLVQTNSDLKSVTDWDVQVPVGSRSAAAPNSANDFNPLAKC